MSVLTATDADFDQVIKTGKPTLIDFWATWCGPCRQIAPVVSAIAEEHPEYAVIKVDVDQANDSAQAFGILSVPTIAILDANGTLVQQFSGPKPKGALLDALAQAAG